MDIYTTMVLMHVIGTTLGVGAATFVEINIIHELSKGRLDPYKSLVVQISYNVLRIGLLLLVLSGVGFLLYARILDFPGYIHSPQFWVKMGVVLVLVATAMLQQLKMISLSLGSAIAITSWYTALVLGVLSDMQFPVFETVLFYIVSIIFMYFIFDYLHSRFSKNSKSL